MKVFFTTAMLLLGVILTSDQGHGQTVKPAAQCVPILEIELVLYPGTDYSKVDNVKACEDGELVAVHAFSAPAFGKAAEERTQWVYPGKLDKDSLADLRKLLVRADIAKMPERQELPLSADRHLPITLQASISRGGKEQRITIQNFPSLSCHEPYEEFTRAQHDLFCAFSGLYAQATSGTPLTGAACGCQTLHAMAAEK
jgi:hypothetical protein